MSDNTSFLKGLQDLYPGGASSPWYIFAGLVVQANDRMDLLGELFQVLHDETPDPTDLIAKVRALREAQLKASVLIGFPKGINGCIALRKAIQATAPALSAELDKDPSLRSSLSRGEKDSRGLAFFQRIYSQHTDRVLENMSLASGGDLSQFAINAVYGDLMAEERRLGAKETGLLEFLACYAAGGSSWSQAKGHMFGSRNLGNSTDEIRAAVNICKAVEEHFQIRVNRQPESDWAWLSKLDTWDAQ